MTMNKLPNLERPDDYVPDDTVTELIYGTYITAEECNELILKNNIYNLTAEVLSSFRDNYDAYWQMHFMSYKHGRFGDGLILIPHPNTEKLYLGCTYIVGLLLGTFEDDVAYNVDDVYCGFRSEKLEALFPLKTYCHLLVRYDVSHCKSKDGVAGFLPP